MSLRRSTRSSSQLKPEQDLPDGRIAEAAAPAKKRGRDAKATEDVATTAVAQNGMDDMKADMPPPPITPNKRRKVAEDAPKPPPITPTPFAIGLMTSYNNTNYSTGGIDDSTSPPQARRLGPHNTNANLVTPGGTQVQAPCSNSEDASPSKPMALPSGSLLELACAHLIAVDPRMKPIIEQHHCRIFSPEGLAEIIDPFRSLASGIMAQQVSGAAAKSIKNKFIDLFPPEVCKMGFPPPDLVAETTIARLREAGLSQRKAEYIQGLAQRFSDGDLTARMLMSGSDEEVMEKLVAVRGLGRWSVEMFMCFALKRMDVFSTGDLGVQRGMAAFVGRDVAKLKGKGGKWKYMKEQEMVDLAERFRPYRSLFMWYMWRVEEVDVNAVQNA